jgi:hypothetical protein
VVGEDAGLLFERGFVRFGVMAESIEAADFGAEPDFES